MSDNLELSASITTEEPEVAATLSDLRYLVFQGMKGDTGDSAYEEAVALGFVGTEAEWIASLKGEKGDPGAVFLELKTVSNRQVITYNGEQITGAEIDAMYLNGALPVVEYSGRIFVPNKNCYNSGSPSARNTSFMFSRPVSAIETTFISVRYDSSVVNIINQMVYPYFDSGDDEGKVLTVGDDDTLHWETPQGGGTAANAVLYTPQSLSDAQKAQARTNVGAGTYSKPSGGIPKSDLASAVQTSLGKADTALQSAPVTSVNNKTGAVVLSASDVGALPSSTSIPTKVSDLTNDSGYQTAQDVQTAVSGKADKVSRVAMTAADDAVTINPNTEYVWPEMASLTITLATPTDSNIVNEYHFIFTSGATATTLSIPATVNQPDGFTVEANHVYEVSILENCMTAQGWAVST